jgi:hypothetical protein
MSTIQVALEDGTLAKCRVIERLGFNHDVGARAAWVEHDGKGFMAVGNRGAWRKWSAADRAQPLRHGAQAAGRLGAAELAVEATPFCEAQKVKPQVAQGNVDGGQVAVNVV